MVGFLNRTIFIFYCFGGRKSNDEESVDCLFAYDGISFFIYPKVPIRTRSFQKTRLLKYGDKSFLQGD